MLLIRIFGLNVCLKFMQFIFINVNIYVKKHWHNKLQIRKGLQNLVTIYTIDSNTGFQNKHNLLENIFINLNRHWNKLLLLIKL